MNPPLCRNIDANPALSSTLPSGWGAAGGASFPALQQLSFSRCLLQGELPAAWGSPGVLPSLRQLFLDFNNLTGGVARAGAAITCGFLLTPTAWLWIGLPLPAGGTLSC